MEKITQHAKRLWALAWNHKKVSAAIIVIVVILIIAQ